MYCCKAARRIAAPLRVYRMELWTYPTQDRATGFKKLEVPFYRTYSCIPLYPLQCQPTQSAESVRSPHHDTHRRQSQSPYSNRAPSTHSKTSARSSRQARWRARSTERTSDCGASSPAGESRSSCPSVPPRPAGGPVRRAHTTTHRIAGMERPPRAIAMTPRTSLRTPRAASV